MWAHALLTVMAATIRDTDTTTGLIPITLAETRRLLLATRRHLHTLAHTLAWSPLAPTTPTPSPTSPLPTPRRPHPPTPTRGTTKISLKDAVRPGGEPVAAEGVLHSRGTGSTMRAARTSSTTTPVRQRHPPLAWLLRVSGLSWPYPNTVAAAAVAFTEAPFTEVAVRVLCWFPEAGTVVVALIGGDKASIGDLWYDSATPRAELAVDQWLRTHPPQQPGGMTTMTNDTTHEFVNLDDYTDAIDDPAVDAVVSRMWDDNHLHRMGLASVREALGFTQADLAAELGVTQSNVAQTERRKDILVSTLARYLGAIGADLHLVVRFEGRPPVELSLDELTEP